MHVIFALFTASAFLGCSSTEESGPTEAEVLFKDANDLMKDGHYIQATEKLNLIRSKHPYSYYATHAELLQADILFKQENYVESSAAYILFKDFHPKHPKSDYVLWRIAESFYHQVPNSHDRDLSFANEAIKYYNELLQKFPNYRNAKAAVEKIAKCKEMLEKKEQYIADFYFKTEEYAAAIYRFKSIVENFSTVELKDYSILKILESAKLLKNKADCTKYFDMYKGVISSDRKEDLVSSFENCKKI
ncbi:MAG: hypothetical protein A2451_09550 [Bdellovibrionales bacterium RIFOXYC2_FULL_39_8]|nr:MAG: hypothetical protein A2451_09550 [Bdellovibrionales bacterium RIFOXYC2_FULL_39_8]